MSALKFTGRHPEPLNHGPLLAERSSFHRPHMHDTNQATARPPRLTILAEADTERPERQTRAGSHLRQLTHHRNRPPRPQPASLAYFQNNPEPTQRHMLPCLCTPLSEAPHV